MLLGLKKDDEAFGDPEHKDSVFNIKGKSIWTPGSEECRNEVRRRYSVFFPTHDEKRCESWKKKRLKQWLRDNPITDPIDITFLCAEEKKC